MKTLETVQVEMLKPAIVCGEGGSSREVEKGQRLDWPAFDAPRAEKNGLLTIIQPAKK